MTTSDDDFGPSFASLWTLGTAQAEIERLTAERDELLTILRDVLYRSWDNTVIGAAHPEDVNILVIHPSLEKWIPRA